MVLIDVGLRKTSNVLEFPTVIRERGLIEFKIHCSPHSIKSQYHFVLYEYNILGEPVKRFKTTGIYKAGYTIGFDMSIDYYTKTDRRYVLILTIYDRNNTEIQEVVFIESTNPRKIQPEKRRQFEQRRISKRSAGRNSRRSDRHGKHS